MKTLIVEDDFTSRILLQKLLAPYGEAHIAVNGREAVTAFKTAYNDEKPYELVCLDIMMPEMDGHAALKEMRAFEESKGILSTNGSKIIITTAISSIKSVSAAYQELCDAYLIKPIDKAELLGHLIKFKMIA